MNKSVTYLAHDDIKETCKFAATIARFKYYDLHREILPPPSSETATVTFIELNNRCYAVTARHVIETFDKLANAEGKMYEGYMCLQSAGAGIGGPFVTPPGTLTEPKPDIAICPVEEVLCSRLGKEPFKILKRFDASWPVHYAVAVGFPTEQKYDTEDELGRTQLTMPCIQAVAESVNSHGSGDQIQFYSELEKKIEIECLSGMSGGPVFWSDGERYGLLGFVKEALDTPAGETLGISGNESRVHFLCQRVDFSVLTRWTNYVDEHWQAERDKINAKIRSQENEQ